MCKPGLLDAQKLGQPLLFCGGENLLPAESPPQSLLLDRAQLPTHVLLFQIPGWLERIFVQAFLL